MKEQKCEMCQKAHKEGYTHEIRWFKGVIQLTACNFHANIVREALLFYAEEQMTREDVAECRRLLFQELEEQDPEYDTRAF